MNKTMSFDRLISSSSDTGQIWVTEFDDKTLQDFYEDFVKLEKDPSVTIIPIIISSYGGDVSIMNAMRDLIKSSTKPVATVALGKAMSAGIALLASGTPGYRFASPNTELMYHEASSMTVGKASDMGARTASVTSMNRLMLKNFCADIGTNVKTWEAEISKRNNTDWFFGAKEALKWHIIDHIDIPRTMFTQPVSVLALNGPKPSTSKRKRKA